VNLENRSFVATAAVRPPAARAALSSAWITHLIGLCSLAGLLGVLNAQAIEAAVEVWWVSPTFSHCFFVIPISTYFVWRKRHVLAALAPAAYAPALWLFPPLILFSLAGKVAHINEVEQLAFVGQLQVLVLAILGLQVYRRILFPSLFLFFLVPMGEYLIAPLQHFTTHFISAGLTLLGIPHYTEVNLIQLSNGDFEVAEACAGLRFLIATIAVSVMFVHLTYSKWHKIIFFLAASFVMPVFANGFRALGIVLLAYWSDNRIAHGADHIIYGWGFLVAILSALMIVGMRYADPIPAERSGGATSAPSGRPVAFALTILLSLAAISFVPALLYRQSYPPSDFDATALSAPLTPTGWETGTLSGNWSPDYATPDASLAFAMHKAGSAAAAVDVFVNFYGAGRRGHNLVSSTNKLWKGDVWHPLSQGAAKAELGGRSVHLAETVIASAGPTRIIWWTYWSGGRFTTSGFEVKLDRLRQALSGDDGSALVAVSTLVDATTAEARARLREAVGALGPVAARLQKASRS
jgi:exosortase A